MKSNIDGATVQAIEKYLNGGPIEVLDDKTIRKILGLKSAVQAQLILERFKLHTLLISLNKGEDPDLRDQSLVKEVQLLKEELKIQEERGDSLAKEREKFSKELAELETTNKKLSNEETKDQALLDLAVEDFITEARYQQSLGNGGGFKTIKVKEAFLVRKLIRFEADSE